MSAPPTARAPKPFLRLLALTAVGGGWLVTAQDCPVAGPSASVPQPPRWRAIPGSGAIHAGIDNGRERLTSGAALASFPDYPFPATNRGALSESVYPQGPPWVTNNAERSSCPERRAGEDCTGARIPRSPGSYFRTGIVPGAGAGFEFHGRFGGRMAGKPDAAGAVLASVFYHESPVYLGHPEYGFYYEPSVPRVVFYWSTNSNCGYSPAICQAQRGAGAVLMYENGSGPGGSAPPPLTRNHGCAVPLAGFRDYVYQAWITGGNRFRVRVLDPATRRDAIPPMLVDPNITGGTWFPIAELAGHQGYLTAGIVRIDPNNSLKPAAGDPPRLTVRSLRVVSAPASGRR